MADTNTGDSQRITFQCSCGKQLAALAKHRGKRVKCPTCGRTMTVPASSSQQPMRTVGATEVQSEGSNTVVLVALWAFVGLFALGAVLFTLWYSRSSQEAQVAAANESISRAVDSANEWATGNSTLTADRVEKQLADALQNVDATERANGEAALAQVRQRRQELAEQAQIEQAEREAIAILKDAKRRLDENDFGKAIELLREYAAHPHAPENAGQFMAGIEQLLAEGEVAVSDAQTLNALVEMSDEEFSSVKAGGEIRDGKVTHPGLLTVRQKTVQRNLNEAVKRREEIRVAEEKRREAERLAAMERQRQEAERRAPTQVVELSEIGEGHEGQYLCVETYIHLSLLKEDKPTAWINFRSSERFNANDSAAEKKEPPLSAQQLLEDKKKDGYDYIVSHRAQVAHDKEYGNTVVMPRELNEWLRSRALEISKPQTARYLEGLLAAGKKYAAESIATEIRNHGYETTMLARLLVFAASPITVTDATYIRGPLNIDPSSGDVTVKEHEILSKRWTTPIIVYGIEVLESCWGGETVPVNRTIVLESDPELDEIGQVSGGA